MFLAAGSIFNAATAFQVTADHDHHNSGDLWHKILCIMRAMKQLALLSKILAESTMDLHSDHTNLWLRSQKPKWLPCACAKRLNWPSCMELERQAGTVLTDTLRVL